MEAFDTGGEEFAEIFVKDEFYESFEAPKFHDFTAPEEEAGDPDAWFSETSGNLSNCEGFSSCSLKSRCIFLCCCFLASASSRK